MATLADMVDNPRLLTLLGGAVDFKARAAETGETTTALNYVFSINLRDYQQMSKAELWDKYFSQALRRLTQMIRRTNAQAGVHAFRRFTPPAETANSRVLVIDRAGFFAVVNVSREVHQIGEGRTQTVVSFDLRCEIVA